MGEEISQLNFSIRQMIVDDLPVVARIHKNAWREDHFSSRLSISLLETYYRSLLKYNTYCLVAESADKLVSFIVAGDKTRIAIKEFLNRNSFSMLFVLLRNPSFLISRIRNYIKIMTSSNRVDSIAEIRLLAIAVHTDYEGHGIGTGIIRKLQETVRTDGHKYLGLSVHKDNHRAIELYDRLGWKVEKQEGSAIYYILELNK
jgi:ribosomal protein S18 acetylase RimI-like enzyme